ncbi:hypothetical protein BU15DRAFT_37963, partial [Melanogaster broomeanus]
EVFVKNKGKRRAFHVGGNSSCRQHIRSHYNLYKDWCAEQGIVENHHTIPRDLYNQHRDTKQMTKKQTN